MKKKRLFFVGIPKEYVKPAIERAHRLGYEVILGDSEENFADKMNLISAADKLVVTDYTNYKDLSSVAYHLQKEAPLDAIQAFRENALLASSMVAQEFSLKGNRPEAVAASINKFTTHNLLKRAGILTPAYALCHTYKDVKLFWEQVNGPVVIKPCSLQGSIGVVEAKTSNELESAYNTCVKYCNELAVLVEEFLVGQEISLEAMVYRGKVVLFGVTEKLLYPGTFIESGHVSPDSRKRMSHEQYKHNLQRIVNALGISFGPLHVEGFHTARGFVPGDIHTRYGGDHIVTLTEVATKCDMISPIFAELGNISYEVTFEQPQEVAGVRFLDVRPGVVTSVEGVKELEELPGIIKIDIKCKTGDTVKALNSSSDRVGCIVAKASTREELEATFKQTFQLLHIVTV
jgi:biotin carboxylase